MMKCDTCGHYTAHEFKERSKDIHDAYCKTCHSRNYVIVKKANGEEMVIDAVSGAVHADTAVTC